MLRGHCDEDLNMKKRLGLKKNEILRGELRIDRLFEQGQKLVKYPFRIFYLQLAEAVPNQVMFVVPKRTFKHAVDRNKVRRKMREAYRLQKEMLEEHQGLQIAIIYIGKEIHDYPFVHNKMRVMMEKLSAALN